MVGTDHRARLLRRALVALGAIASALLLAEGLVRLFFDEPVQPRYVIDAGYGVRANKPGVETRHRVPGEYDVEITTNSAGMRGPREYPLERVPRTRRVLVLGDSFAFGYGVGDDAVVTAVLEEILGRTGRRAEVLNLAVSGSGQAEELITWRCRGKAYRPDVVVMFYFDNDIGNNAVSKLFTLRTGGVLERTGTEFLPGSDLQERMLAFAPTRWLFEHSEAWNLLRNRLSAAVQRSMLREQGLATFRDATTEATELTRALLMQFVGDVREADARPAFVIVPEGRTLTSNFPLRAAELSAMSVPTVDGREFLQISSYYPRDSHWRPEAHRKVAEHLAVVVDSLAP